MTVDIGHYLSIAWSFSARGVDFAVYPQCMFFSFAIVRLSVVQKHEGALDFGPRPFELHLIRDQLGL